MLDSLTPQHWLWLEQAGLSVRTSVSRRDGDDWYTAQVVLTAPTLNNVYVEWCRAEDKIGNVAVAKAFEAAQKKGKPQSPTEAFNAIAQLSADKDREIAELKAQMEAMALKAKPADPPKAPAKQ